MTERERARAAPDVTRNARWVKRHAPAWAELRDLEQEGWLALLQGRKYSHGAMVDYLRREYLHHRASSFECAIGSEEKFPGGVWKLPDDSRPSPADAAMLAELRRRLLAAMQCLTPQHRSVVQWRYFLDDYQAAASGLAVSFGRVSQLHKQAIERLRAQIGLDYAAIFPLRLDRPHVSERLLPNSGITGRKPSPSRRRGERAVAEVC